MKSITIQLNTIADIRDLVNLVTACDFDVDLASGRYVVDAKSIMGIFSLDLMSPITLTAHSDDCADFMAKVAKYQIK